MNTESDVISRTDLYKSMTDVESKLVSEGINRSAREEFHHLIQDALSPPQMEGSTGRFPIYPASYGKLVLLLWKIHLETEQKRKQSKYQTNITKIRKLLLHCKRKTLSLSEMESFFVSVSDQAKKSESNTDLEEKLCTLKTISRLLLFIDKKYPDKILALFKTKNTLSENRPLIEELTLALTRSLALNGNDSDTFITLESFSSSISLKELKKKLEEL